MFVVWKRSDSVGRFHKVSVSRLPISDDENVHFIENYVVISDYANVEFIKIVRWEN